MADLQVLQGERGRGGGGGAHLIAHCAHAAAVATAMTARASGESTRLDAELGGARVVDEEVVHESTGEGRLDGRHLRQHKGQMVVRDGRGVRVGWHCAGGARGVRPRSRHGTLKNVLTCERMCFTTGWLSTSMPMRSRHSDKPRSSTLTASPMLPCASRMSSAMRVDLLRAQRVGGGIASAVSVGGDGTGEAARTIWRARS